MLLVTGYVVVVVVVVIVVVVVVVVVVAVTISMISFQFQINNLDVGPKEFVTPLPSLCWSKKIRDPTKNIFRKKKSSIVQRTLEQ